MPLVLQNGDKRTFLEDGDEIFFTAHAQKQGFATIGFGECRGTVMPGIGSREYMIRLYDYWRSGASYRVRIALNLKGIPYESVPVDLRSRSKNGAEYRMLNPQELVPALELEGKILTQSPAILEWLEERYPEPRLLPADPGRTRRRSGDGGSDSLRYSSLEQSARFKCLALGICRNGRANSAMDCPMDHVGLRRARDDDESLWQRFCIRRYANTGRLPSRSADVFSGKVSHRSDALSALMRRREARTRITCI